ncbi:hypothetical protein [Bdellovibrio sp. BCCA]|uniref:hypothetical protein n=1 Tax=Bdellovibrio sp. BCCA TaxID=3136281 RepID=UPI0030F03B43
MKRIISYSMIAFFALSSFAFAQTVPVQFQKGSLTPSEVQTFVTKLFNKKCQGAVAKALEVGTTPYTDFEDNYHTYENRNVVSAHYDIVYDAKFPRDMVATIAINYTLLENGGVKINAARIMGAWDTSHCEAGIYRVQQP